LLENSRPILYDAMENKAYSLNCDIDDSYVLFRLDLFPYESTFLIFKKEKFFLDKNITSIPSSNQFKDELVTLDGCSISYCEIEAYPEFTPLMDLISLINVAVPGILPKFSGTLRYECKFKYTATTLERRRYLDLGEVYETAEVWLNNSHLGVKICPPYRFDVTDILLHGQNQLCVEVTNTLAKKIGNNIFDRAMPQEPSGLIGPICISVLI
jgi:hypothetical protein